ncbi:hypothetical protein COX22_01890 [Candidatus Falkowbacteria bacterium CG23_combo_of_CG06-09_8_20_14_all_49_15]|uniref:Uncharacterized protein n=1 Tax=Candidatus Falkowbacteria bacterium CG23_combo_of_CG06-09_8_20_14_all_49_15 TaxID=1974572 RepID=A0A2G9ZMV9_9BACT|nr:MAG: hypothetical protein COX22_01890 [Candidatus Falkowbacteria bacterium CG23_combo_of_CG06-09_8_20_14_all_49_15]
MLRRYYKRRRASFQLAQNSEAKKEIFKNPPAFLPRDLAPRGRDKSPAFLANISSLSVPRPTFGLGGYVFLSDIIKSGGQQGTLCLPNSIYCRTFPCAAGAKFLSTMNINVSNS